MEIINVAQTTLPDLDINDIVVTISSKRVHIGSTAIAVIVASALEHHFAGVKPVVVISVDGDFETRRSELNIEPVERHELLLECTQRTNRIFVVDTGRTASDYALEGGTRP
jgi:hypothetical protein